MDTLDFFDGIYERSDFQENGCILWKGALIYDRYPRYNNMNIRNYIWKFYNGTNEPVKLKNLCRDETCININHLYTGEEKLDTLDFFSDIYERSVFQEDGCIIWTGALSRDTYPRWKKTMVRNYIWKIYNETDKIVKLENSCGNTKCINIKHLYIEDKWDNVKLRIKEGNLIDEKTGCHKWKNWIGNNGYGQISFDGVPIMCHHITYMLANGIKEIPEGMIIRHKCKKTRNCNNPEHLEIGTLADNSADRIRDGTTLDGEKNPACKITLKTATLIKHSKYPKGHEYYKPQKVRAIEFDVSIHTIRKIDCCESWKHVPDRDGNTTTVDNVKKRKKYDVANNQEYTDEKYEEIRDGLKRKSILTSERTRGTAVGDCWEHTNTPFISGYVSASLCGFIRFAHVWGAMVHHKRKRGPGDTVVRHLCNNKPCCNPDHVEFGSRSLNSIDSIKNEHKGAKLSEQKVREIRSSTKKRKELVEEYGVSYNTITGVLNNKTWTWVK